ncbi:Bifunctional NAD(P)H-hydrate repair enzyme Nnr [Enhygromyxa salina]|uniref:ADP-dependent (S)-NAD(P)H-hydrate dehydratase n=2 Tax=Enhygromyxa salina TaxID=215803 RepID=A0A2S9XD88_9BACT|nr:Bifunctional NAD(P)H-hydrate repair enzyme Nnr [Enhygromyxa salina]
MSAAHKGRRGHVGVIGGSGGMPGAAILAATAAMRAGAGLATLAPGDPELRRALIELRPELMLATAEQAWKIPQAQVLVVGPGLVNADRSALAELNRDDARAMVWDASGLEHQDAGPAAGPRVLTPHPGEAARMLARLDRAGSWDSARVQSNRALAATRLAELTRAIVVLKGAGTIVAEADGARVRVAICTTGGPALATAGSGDVLAGAIAALLARGLEPWAAACAGVHVHGLAGDRSPQNGTLALDIADALALALDEASTGTAWPSGWPTQARY